MSTQHATRKHALLSASGAARWLNCTPSARLEEKFQESSSSVFAQEGTLAHELADVTLRHLNGEIDTKTLARECRKIKKNNLYTDEMPSQVTKYCDYVMETLNVERKTTPDAILNVEERLDFSHVVEQGFGTGDACIISDGTMYVIDLKYGKGVQVYAENNPQLMLYGLGALRTYEAFYDIDKVVLVIVQPRLDHISEWSLSAEDLVAWGDYEVRPKAALAYKGDGEKCAGNWCKWCKVKATCRTLAEENLKLADHDFVSPHLLTDDELVAIFEQVPMLQDWASAVADHLLKQAIKGKEVRGYKVVEGRSNRKFTDEGRAKKILSASGLSPDKYLVTKLATLTAIEKLFPTKKDFAELMADVVIKPQGKPTLVPKGDKRPPMKLTADQDFS